MYKYSKRSLRELESANNLLQMVFKEAINVVDITIVKGKRGQIEQDEEYYETPKVTIERLLKLEQVMNEEINNLTNIIEP